MRLEEGVAKVLSRKDYADVERAEAKRDLERARKAKRDANSLKIHAGQQRGEVDGTVATVLENQRAHIGRTL
jgi:acetyl-CoA carboxylase carboxyltransferase component